MAGGNGHLGGLDNGAVLRIRIHGYFRPQSKRFGKPIRIIRAKRRQRKVRKAKTEATQHPP